MVRVPERTIREEQGLQVIKKKGGACRMRPPEGSTVKSAYAKCWVSAEVREESGTRCVHVTQPGVVCRLVLKSTAETHELGVGYTPVISASPGCTQQPFVHTQGRDQFKMPSVHGSL